MNATYFNFSTVISTVDSQIMSNLNQSNTIEQFKILSLKATKEDKVCI